MIPMMNLKHRLIAEASSEVTKEEMGAVTFLCVGDIVAGASLDTGFGRPAGKTTGNFFS